MGVLSESYPLSNGCTIPKLGFGTWQTPDDIAGDAVKMALAAGYTHIDTARAYGNEAGVGQGVKASGLDRGDLYITTKIPAERKSYDEAVASIKESLAALDLGYIDLLLIHAPKPWPEMFKGGDKLYFTENLAVWRAMEEAYQRGEVRSIGVSNFDVADLKNITDNADIPPVANQIRFHIGWTQPEITAYCQDQGIVVEAYSPLGTGRLLDDPGIAAIATRCGKSVAQVCLRYTLQKGTLPLPKSVHEPYITANADLDFELTADDMAALDASTVAGR